MEPDVELVVVLGESPDCDGTSENHPVGLGVALELETRLVVDVEAVED